MKTVYIIGTGPGDKKYLTLEAVDTLKTVDKIYAPVHKNKNRSLDTIKDFVDEEKIVKFPVKMGEITEEGYGEIALAIEKELEEFNSIALVTIGDAMFYSTSINIEKHFSKEIEVKVVSGIPSFVAAAGVGKIPLTYKGERLLVVDEIPDNLENVDSLAILKTRDLDREFFEKLEELGFEYKYFSNVSYENGEIITELEDILKEKNYMSLIISRRKR